MNNGTFATVVIIIVALCLYGTAKIDLADAIARAPFVVADVRDGLNAIMGMR